MSKKSAKRRQPMKFVVVKEPTRTAKDFGCEEMSSGPKTTVVDAKTRLTENKATA